MTEHAYYNQAIHGPYETHSIGDHVLEEGGTIRGCTLAYATFGTLNAAKDNAILVPTWYSGTTKIMEQVYIGAGRALDPAKYFIIAINQIGNGLSTSPHNTPFPGGGPNFPRVRIGDDVRAQHKLITEKFGIERLALVVGGSMGAQQTYEWAVRYPDMVRRAAPIAGTAKNTPHDYLFAETLIEAITSDPAFKGGWYGSPLEVHQGLRRHVVAAAIGDVLADEVGAAEMLHGIARGAHRRRGSRRRAGCARPWRGGRPLCCRRWKSRGRRRRRRRRRGRGW